MKLHIIVVVIVIVVIHGFHLRRPVYAIEYRHNAEIGIVWGARHRPYACATTGIIIDLTLCWTKKKKKKKTPICASHFNRLLDLL